MKEVLEIDDVLDGGKEKEKNVIEGKEAFFSDSHLIDFEAETYPKLPRPDEEDGSSSPRIPNANWRKYEQKSEDKASATKLRTDSSLLDIMIQVF